MTSWLRQCKSRTFMLLTTLNCSSFWLPLIKKGHSLSPVLWPYLLHLQPTHTQVCALKVSQGPWSTLKYHFWHNFFLKSEVKASTLAYTAWPSPPSPEASTVLWWELEPKSSWRPHYQGCQEYSPLVCHPLPAKAVLHVISNAITQSLITYCKSGSKQLVYDESFNNYGQTFMNPGGGFS